MASEIATFEANLECKDVYPAPIALGFQDLTEPSDSACASETYGPLNYSESDQCSNAMSYNKDVRDPNAVRGRCGLYNLGNTCFMNAGLQCLMGTVPLVQFMLDFHQRRMTCDNTLLGEFQKLFAKIWSGQFSVVYPKDFKQMLGVYHSQFKDFRQHDCQEFLALLLDSLHEQLNIKGQSTNQNTEAQPSFEKQPIRFEHNINNKSNTGINLSCLDMEITVNDTSKNTITSHSTLTFDNMKQSIAGQTSRDIDKKFDCTKSGKRLTNLYSLTVNMISEDSNHSTISEQSSDSDQCSVIKNLKLRSSPTVNQSHSSGSLSPKRNNRDQTRECSVSSSDEVGPKYDLNKEDSAENMKFKRVKSLQDFKTGDDWLRLHKASSDNDLVSKASVKIDESCAVNSEVNLKAEFGSGHICIKDLVSSGLQKSVDKKPVHSPADNEPLILNNAVLASNIPSIEDLYAKETKTLNTNMLATAYMEDDVATDSEKFAKHDNTTVLHSELLIEEDFLTGALNVAGKNDNFEAKRIKDVNVRTEKKSKSPKGASGSNGMSVEKEDVFALNSVKRMKFEGTEKNLQMQEICKIQKESLLSRVLRESKTLNENRSSCVSCINNGVTSSNVDSDLDSDVNDEHDNDMEISDDNEMEEAVISEPPFLAEDASYTAAEVLAAEEAWLRYKSTNDSIIVDSFQGQFKSTVVCSRCKQVSVTFEPFMYLSLPIPHAMERQLCVTFISHKMVPTQYLLVLHKQDKVLKVKQELRTMIGRETDEIIVAEVLNWHISRILEDNTMLRYINDTSRKIYAFEIDPSLNGLSDVPSSFAQDVASMTSQDSNAAQGDVFSNMGSFSRVSAKSSNSKDPSATCSEYEQCSQSEDVWGSQSAGVSGDLDTIGTRLWEWEKVDGHDKRQGGFETGDNDWLLANGTNSVSSYDMVGDVVKEEMKHSLETKEKTVVNSSSAASKAADNWKSCAICLEELTDNELMVHTTCAGTFCSSCLEMSAQHYSESSFCCPVCSTPAVMTEDFVPLESAANHKPKTRIVSIPISYRCETDFQGTQNPFLFSHPSLLNLPSNLTGEHIYRCIRKLKPNLHDCSIFLTDGTGLRCSRCLYMDHCSGCVIPYDGETILRPSDHLTVSITSVTMEMLQESQFVYNHTSTDTHRSDEPVTLLDCFRAFTQSEELDEHNPWFCPHCRENQKAEKTMTVWQYPDTLIIHLKRFVFHELSSTKVDNKVIFPLDNLDLCQFISGPKIKNLIYKLYSLVCHFGGASSGHYTSYTMHPVDGKWCYYNDESVTESLPADEEFSSTYVLFYQRKDNDKVIQIPNDLDLNLEADGSGYVAVSSTTFPKASLPEAVVNVDCTASSSSLPISSSSYAVVASTGVCDLLDVKQMDSNDQSEDDWINFYFDSNLEDKKG